MQKIIKPINYFNSARLGGVYMASSNGVFTKYFFFLLFPPQHSLHCLYGVYTFRHGLRSTTNGVRHVEILQFQNTWLQGLLQRLCFRALKLKKEKKTAQYSK